MTTCSFVENKNVKTNLNESGFLKRRVGTILINGLKPFGRGFHPDKLIELGNPDTLGVEIR